LSLQHSHYRVRCDCRLRNDDNTDGDHSVNSVTIVYLFLTSVYPNKFFFWENWSCKLVYY